MVVCIDDVTLLNEEVVLSVRVPSSGYNFDWMSKRDLSCILEEPEGVCIKIRSIYETTAKLTVDQIIKKLLLIKAVELQVLCNEFEMQENVKQVIEAYGKLPTAVKNSANMEMIFKSIEGLK